MANVRRPPIAVTSGANTPILATTFARYVEISEDALAAPGGLVVTYPNGSIATYSPAQQPIVIGNPGGAINMAGSNVGVPANYNGGGGAATLYCNVKSVGATSQVRVMELN